MFLDSLVIILKIYNFIIYYIYNCSKYLHFILNSNLEWWNK